MKKILVTGVSGYLGPYLCKELAKDKENSVTGLYNSNKISTGGIEVIQCDLANFNRLKEIFNSIKPDIVYHLASVTPTRITNQTDDYIEFFNSTVTAELSKLCSDAGSLMIYTSTDLVYDEGRDLEEDNSKLNPLTIYAATKLLGEGAVKMNAERYIILRTALVYGFTLSSYTSFFDIAYAKLKNGETVNAFTDQFRNPLYTEDAATILSGLPAKYTANDTINFCGGEFLSRYEMCTGMCGVFGFDNELVIPSGSDEFTKYPMVKKLGLSTKKLDSYGFKTMTFKENLERAVKFKP